MNNVLEDVYKSAKTTNLIGQTSVRQEIRKRFEVTHLLQIDRHKEDVSTQSNNNVSTKQLLTKQKIVSVKTKPQ